MEPNDNGHETLASLREEPSNPHLLRGYGPLVAGALLFVLMVLLAPTVAPEKVVLTPASTTTTTTAPPASPTSTTVAP
jgi:hypothetical protein